MRGRGLYGNEAVCRACGTFDPVFGGWGAAEVTIGMNVISLVCAAVILLFNAVGYYDIVEPFAYFSIISLPCAFFASELLSLTVCALFWKKRAMRKTLSKLYTVLSLMSVSSVCTFLTSPEYVLLMFLPQTAPILASPFIFQIITCVILARRTKKEEEYK